MYIVQENVPCTIYKNMYFAKQFVSWFFFHLLLASGVIYFTNFSFTNFFLSNKVKKIYYIQQLYCLKKVWFFREITSPVGSEYFSVVGLDRHLRVYKIKGK